jgi:hypothetical protein
MFNEKHEERRNEEFFMISLVNISIKKKKLCPFITYICNVFRRSLFLSFFHEIFSLCWDFIGFFVVVFYLTLALLGHPRLDVHSIRCAGCIYFQMHNEWTKWMKKKLKKTQRNLLFCIFNARFQSLIYIFSAYTISCNDYRYFAFALIFILLPCWLDHWFKNISTFLGEFLLNSLKKMFPFCYLLS